MNTTIRSYAEICEAIVAQCAARAPDATICPSEVARALWPGEWREHMDDVRSAGLALAREGKIDITQGGERRDPDGDIRGVIRYRLRR